MGLCLARAPVRAERERYRAGGDEEREDRHDQAAVDRSRVRQRAAGAPPDPRTPARLFLTCLRGRSRIAAWRTRESHPRRSRTGTTHAIGGERRGHIAGTWYSPHRAPLADGRRQAHPGGPGHVVDTAPPRGCRGGDLLRARRLRGSRFSGRARATRAHTTSVRATASSTSRSRTRTRCGPARRARRPRLRTARVCAGRNVAAARGGRVARRDLGTGGRRGRPSLGARSRGRAARGRRALAAAREHRQRRRRRSRWIATAPP